MAAANALFPQADTNNDQRLDLNEFRNRVSASGLGGLGANSGYESSSQSSSYESSATGSALGGDLGYAGAVGSNLGYGGAGYGADLSSANYSSSSQNVAVQRYATNAQGLFQDSNPQIIRRPAQGGNLTYTQNVRVRFLQPPPVPPPGVSFPSLFI